MIRTLNIRIYKHMTSISKNRYIDKLNDIVNGYNNTYHRTTKMKPVDVKDNMYIHFGKGSNNKDSKFQVHDLVRISKYKNIFAKEYTPNWSENFFMIKKVRNTVPWTYVISDLNGEEIVGAFCKKKTNQEHFRIEKVSLWEKQISYVPNGKAMIIHLMAGLMKETLYKMSQYFPKPHGTFGGDINVKVHLFN